MRPFVLTCCLFVLAVLGLQCDLDKIEDTTTCDGVITAQFSIDKADCPAPCELTFTNTSQGAVTSAWTFGDGQSAGTKDAKHNYAAAGTYEVQLIVFSADGCSDTALQTITVGKNTEKFVQSINATNFNIWDLEQLSNGGYAVVGNLDSLAYLLVLNKYGEVDSFYQYKNFIDPKAAIEFNSLVVDQDFIYVAGLAFGASQVPMFVYKINPLNGKIEDEVTKTTSNTSYFSREIHKKGDFFYVTGWLEKQGAGCSSVNQQPILWRLSSNLQDVGFDIKSYTLGLNCQKLMGSLLNDDGNNILISGSRTISNGFSTYSKLFFYRVGTSAGDSLFYNETSLKAGNYFNNVLDVLREPDGTFWACGGYTATIGIGGFEKSGLVFKLNANLAVESTLTNVPNIDYFSGLAKSGEKYVATQPFNKSDNVLFFDNNGTKGNLSLPLLISKVISTSDGGFAFLGKENNVLTLIKTDANGNYQ